MGIFRPDFLAQKVAKISQRAQVFFVAPRCERRLAGSRGAPAIITTHRGGNMSASLRSTSRSRLICSAIFAGAIFLGVLFARWLTDWTTAPTAAMVQQALTTAEAHPDVAAALGIPLVPGPNQQGWNVKYEALGYGYVAIPSPFKTRATIDMPVMGPKGPGIIQGHAFRSDGKWYFANLNVHVRTGAGPFRLVETPTIIIDPR
jgi:hypothetical protein